MALAPQPKDLDTSSSHTDEFVHQPLDLSKKTIRTIRILPGPQGSGIKCELQLRSIGPASQNDYVCLSYMWGDEDNAQDIEVDGRLHRVRRNLWDFLVTAREMEIRDWLWIDAISIDQNNLKERNHQVTQMGEIYGLAKRVLIWPGVFPHKMRGLRVIAKIFRRLYNSAPSRLYRLVRLLLPIHWIHQRRMIELDRRRYWKRLWIVQEVLLAQEAFVVLGKRLVSWDDIAEWCLHLPLSDKPTPAAHIYVLANDRNNISKAATRQLKFFGRIGLFYKSECTDIRDRVFGILGLLEDTAPITVNYSESAAVLFINCIWSFGPHGPDDPYQSSGYFLLRYDVNFLSRALNVMPLLLCPHSTFQHPRKAPSARDDYFSPPENSIYLLLTVSELEAESVSTRSKSQAFETAFCSECSSPAMRLIDLGDCQVLERPDPLDIWIKVSRLAGGDSLNDSVKNN